MYDGSNTVVLNNPLAFTDPTGLVYNGKTDGGGACDITCIVVTAGIGVLIDGLENLFGGGPSFHGSLKPRPNAQPWDEYNIHYGPNIAGALGLPDAGCDFGACGGGIDYFQQGNAPSVSKAWSLAKAFGQVAWYSFLASQNIHAPYADPSDPNHRLFGTHYCGPGGGGTITSPTDNACYLHDKCYTDNGFSPVDNFNPFLSISQGHKLQGCNQALCDATAQINNGAATAIGGYFTGTGIYHCSTY